MPALRRPYSPELEKMNCPRCKGSLLHDKLNHVHTCLSCGHDISDSAFNLVSNNHNQVVNNNDEHQPAQKRKLDDMETKIAVTKSISVSMKTYVCNRCDFTTEDRFKLVGHISSVHYHEIRRESEERQKAMTARENKNLKKELSACIFDILETELKKIEAELPKIDDLDWLKERLIGQRLILLYLQDLFTKQF